MGSSAHEFVGVVATTLILGVRRLGAGAFQEAVRLDVVLRVDIIATDPSVALEQSRGVINEVNTTPALHHHYDVRKEACPRAAVAAIEYLLSRSSTKLNINKE